MNTAGGEPFTPPGTEPRIVPFPLGLLTPASMSVIISEVGMLASDRYLRTGDIVGCLLLPSLTHPLLGHVLLSGDLFSLSPEVLALLEALDIPDVLNYQ